MIGAAHAILDELPEKRSEFRYAAYGTQIIPNLLSLAERAVRYAKAGEEEGKTMVKEARDYFTRHVNTPFFEAIKKARVDGKEIGLDVPIRIEFGSDAVKDAFLMLGKVQPELKEDPATYKQHSDSLDNQPSPAAAKVEREFVDRLAKSAAFSAPVQALRSILDSIEVKVVRK